jgi:hypothetical protein
VKKRRQKVFSFLMEFSKAKNYKMFKFPVKKEFLLWIFSSSSIAEQLVESLDTGKASEQLFRVLCSHQRYETAKCLKKRY